MVVVGKHVIHFCLLWFSAKTQLLKINSLLPFQRQPSFSVVIHPGNPLSDKDRQ